MRGCEDRDLAAGGSVSEDAFLAVLKDQGILQQLGCVSCRGVSLFDTPHPPPEVYGCGLNAAGACASWRVCGTSGRHTLTNDFVDLGTYERRLVHDIRNIPPFVLPENRPIQPPHPPPRARHTRKGTQSPARPRPPKNAAVVATRLSCRRPHAFPVFFSIPKTATTACRPCAARSW